MTHRLDVARGRDVLARWCDLAEQRLEYLTELFETGRWRRFHSELAFLENIQEAKAAVEIWRDLSTREASPDNSAVDISWLGHARAAQARGAVLRDQVPWRRPQPAQIAAEPPPSDIPAASQAVRVFAGDAPSAPDADAPALDNAPELTLDLTVMQQRYPLLRNAL
ncbi:MAG TPA: TIGR03809 family protein [Xanthobacteraceae bacterium]